MTSKRKCQASIHDADCDYLFGVSRDSKVLKRQDVEHMYEQGYIKRTDRGFICECCLDKIIPEHQYSITRKKQTLEAPKEENDNTGPSNNCDLSLEIAKIKECLEPLIQKDVTQLYKDGKPTLDQLVQYNAKEWLQDRPKQLVDLMKSLCGDDILTDDKKCYRLAKIVEQLYYFRNSRLILPLSFREVILLYSFTYSKQAINLMCKTTPSSSYTTVSRYLADEASEPVQMPSGSVRVGFDNNQVIGKTYVIKGDNKVPTSVMTSVSYSKLSDSKIQEKKELKPEFWMWRDLSNEEKESMTQVIDDEMDQLIKETRNKHIEHHLNLIQKQMCAGNGNQDYVDEQISREREAAEMKVCLGCGMGNDSSYRICRSCGGPLQQLQIPDVKEAATKHEDIKENPRYSYRENIPITPNDVKVLPGEPEMVNPNSYETIISVLRSIGHSAGIKRYGGNVREWLFIECDGLPYKIVRDICDNVFLCQRCRGSFYGTHVFESEDHRCYVLAKEECCSMRVREFDWVVPVVGLLHLEMNATRAFISMNWDIFVSRLAYVVGFESVKAQLYCKKGSDHHKSWNLLEILYVSLTEELLIKYVQQCHKDKTSVSVQGYWDWALKTEDPNYNYLQQMVFTYLHSLMVFRTGVRHNNVKAIHAGMMKFTPMLYGRSHPKYQDILYRNLRDQVTMPSELRTALYETFTYNRTGSLGHYQGGDANLEELNKEAKTHVSSAGVPKEKDWEQVFRNLPKMKTVRKATMDSIGMVEHSSESARHLRPKPIGRVRVAVRRSGYLSDPLTKKPHKSLDNKVDMNPDLQHFDHMAKQKRVNYIRDRINGQVPNTTTIALTLEEADYANSINSKTVKEVKALILQALDKLPQDIAALMEDDYKRNIKRGKKTDLVDFFHRIQEESDTVTPGGIDNEDDDDDEPAAE